MNTQKKDAPKPTEGSNAARSQREDEHKIEFDELDLLGDEENHKASDMRRHCTLTRMGGNQAKNMMQNF